MFAAGSRRALLGRVRRVRDPHGRRRRPLARLSRGNPRRAALILLACYLAALPSAWGAWALGLAPVFDDARPVAIGLVAAVGLATLGTLVLVFGSPPLPTAAGLTRGYGERYDSFGARAGSGLGLLRLLLQLAVTGSCLAALFFALLDVRWFHLVPTAEMRSLPSLAAAMPVPADWRLVSTDRDVEVDDEVKVPNAHLVRVYDLPEPVPTDVLRTWLSAPTWADAPDGRAFGAIALERCNASTTRCDAHLVPAPGRQPEFFVTAHLSGLGSDVAQVQVRIRYQHQIPSSPGASDAIVERAARMPIPADWVRYEVSGEGARRATQEHYVQSFGVPDTFTPADLEAWLAAPAWTAPASGPPFGAISVDEPCHRPTYGTTASACSLTVTATEGQEVVESFEVRLGDDHTVVIDLERDW